MKAAKNKEKSAAVTLRIEGEMTIYRAAELKETLLAPLEPHVTLEIDLSAVTDIDTSGLQLLMLAKKTAKQREGELRLTGHSPAVLDVMELFNLAGYFGDQIVIAPRAGEGGSGTSANSSARS